MRHGKYATAVFLIIALIALIRCTGNRQSADTPRSAYAGLDSTTAYAGMETCRQCHADIYETFSHTGMGLSFETASMQKSAAGKGPHPAVYDAALDFYYQAYWEGDSLLIREFRLDNGDTVFLRSQTVHYIVGSGQHTNSHLYSLNGYLHQAPLTYYTQQGRWDLPPGFENGGNSRFSRLIGLECISCHNAYPEMVMGSENKYRSVKNGIDCERCHGPGSRHVAEKRAGKIVDVTKAIDYSIVNPSKLPADLQFDVCQRCHIQGNAVLNEGRSFFDFKPGMPLKDVMNVFMPVWKGRDDEHIMASHAERLKMSRCYRETAGRTSRERDLPATSGTFTCISCHNPHVSVRSTDPGRFNTTCRSCHDPGRNGCTEKHDVLETARFNCVQCHMAASGATDIPHVRVTDHYIRIPVEDKTLEQIKTFAGIACINNPDPPDRARGVAFINYFEKFGFDRFALDSALTYFPEENAAQVKQNLKELVHIRFLEKNYALIARYAEQAKIRPGQFGRSSWAGEDAWTCYRIGEAFSNLGSVATAVQFLQRATRLEPYNLDFQSVYGKALMRAGRAAEAGQVFEYILSEFPDHEQALSNLGYVLLLERADTARARMLYERSLSLDPDYLPAQYNMAGLHIFRKNYGEARKVLGAILSKHPDETRAKEILRSLGGS